MNIFVCAHCPTCLHCDGVRAVARESASTPLPAPGIRGGHKVNCPSRGGHKVMPISCSMGPGSSAVVHCRQRPTPTAARGGASGPTSQIHVHQQPAAVPMADLHASIDHVAFVHAPLAHVPPRHTTLPPLKPAGRHNDSHLLLPCAFCAASARVLETSESASQCCHVALASLAHVDPSRTSSRSTLDVLEEARRVLTDVALMTACGTVRSRVAHACCIHHGLHLAGPVGQTSNVVMTAHRGVY